MARKRAPSSILPGTKGQVVFCLGVALSLKETEDFARRLELPVEGQGYVYGFGIAGRLTELCGAKPGFTTERCDQGGGSAEWIWVLFLKTNYGSPGVDIREPLRKYRENVEGAFGSSKKAMWWLNYMANHTPDCWRVSAEVSTVFVLIGSVC